MFKRLAVAFCVVSCIAAAAIAAPLHASDPNYRGAFTLLAAASADGASARYSTEISIFNLSNHTVNIRVELYSTTGYREGVWVNNIPAQSGGTSFWGGKQPSWEYTDILGTTGMGALRIVAVDGNGKDDPSAVLHGIGRLHIEPYSGGRLTEAIPTLTDYEASGSFRRSRYNPGAMPGGVDYVPFIIDARPWAKDLHDTTYGGSRMNIGMVNFDTEHDAVFTIPERNEKDFWGNTAHADAIQVTVPAGSTRQVAVPMIFYVGNNTPPIFPYDTPLDRQVFLVAHSGGNDSWAAYATMVDGTTSGSTFFLDMNTAIRQ